MGTFFETQCITTLHLQVVMSTRNTLKDGSTSHRRHDTWFSWGHLNWLVIIKAIRITAYKFLGNFYNCTGNSHEMCSNLTSTKWKVLQCVTAFSKFNTGHELNRAEAMIYCSCQFTHGQHGCQVNSGLQDWVSETVWVRAHYFESFVYSISIVCAPYLPA